MLNDLLNISVRQFILAAATVAVLLVSAAGLSIWLAPRGMDASTSMLDATPPLLNL